MTSTAKQETGKPRRRAKVRPKAGNTPEFELPPDTKGIQWTGERFVVGLRGEIEFEHCHRYLFAAQFCDGRDVLDVACGEGYGGFLLSQVARSVVGVDIDTAVIEHASRSYGSKKLRFTHGTCLKLPAEDQSFDIVVSFETIEHIREHDQFLAEVRRVLRPDGVLIISTPDHDVYSKPEEPNPFHLLEMTKSEFQATLSRQFSRIEIGLQKATTGSIILQDRQDQVAMQVFRKANAKIFELSDTLQLAPFLLAIASNVELPFIHWSILEDPQFFQDLGKEAERRNVDIEQLVGQVNERDRRLAAADGELREVIATAASDLRRHVTEVQDRDQRLVAADKELERVVARADSDLRRAVGEIETRDKQLAAADGEVRRLLVEIGHRDQRLVAAHKESERVVARADSDLRRAIGEIETRDKQLAAADGEVRRLLVEIGHRDQRLVAADKELERVVARADSDLRRAVGETETRDKQLAAADGEVRRLLVEIGHRDQRLTAASEELERVVAQSDGDLRLAMNEIESRDKQLAAANGEVRRLLVEVGDRDQWLVAASEKLARVVAESDGDLRQAMGEIETRDKQLAAADEEVRRLIVEVGDRDQWLVAASEKLARVVAQSNGDLQQAMNEVETRDKQLAAADQEVRRLLAEVNDREQRLTTVNGDLRKLINEAEDHKRRLIAVEGEFGMVKCKVTGLEAELAGAQSELAQAKTHADALASKLEQISNASALQADIKTTAVRRLMAVTARLQRELVAANLDKRSYQRQLDEILQSRSWRLTGPVRRAVTKLRRRPKIANR